MAARDRTRWYGVLTVTLTVLLVLGLAELVLRFLPVGTGLHAQSVTAAAPVFHFEPNRTFTYSQGWDFEEVNHGRVNNAGWVNAQDYRRDDHLPLLAVIGDSFVEALMVPQDQTLQARLAKALEGRMRVYSFAASGAPLSQYLIWAQHAVRTYAAQALVITVVGNDFDESHAAYKTGPGFWTYVQTGDGLELRLFAYHRSALAGLVHHSALARYLYFNLRLGGLWQTIQSWLFGGPAQAAPRYAGNTTADASPARVAASLAVIDAFFRDLPRLTGLPPDRVLFILDGFRYPGRAAEWQGTYFDRMRRAFRAKAQALGYEAVDLDPLFFDRHAATGQRFEFPHDGHWNAAGHAVAADAVLRSDLVRRLIAQYRYRAERRMRILGGQAVAGHPGRP